MGNNRSYLPNKKKTKKIQKQIKKKQKTKTNKKTNPLPPIFIVEMGLRDKGL